MSWDSPTLAWLAVYLLGASMAASAPRSASHWQLETGADGVVSVRPSLAEHAAKVASQDPVLTILVQQRRHRDPSAAAADGRDDDDKGIDDVGINIDIDIEEDGDGGASLVFRESAAGQRAEVVMAEEGECVACEKMSEGDRPKFQKVRNKVADPLECTKHVNKTAYDSLPGIVNRQKHPSIPEPEVALIFKRTDSDQVDMSALEASLREAITLTPNSLAVLNQVGNYWRIKGNTLLAVECFRKALALAPTHPDILLNLARVLFNVGSLADALLLTEKSLRHKGAEQNAWLQHFTLGEVHKALGNKPEAGVYFRHSLDLNPTFHPAEAHLRDLEQPAASTNATVYTILIIGVLILAVCVVLYYVTEAYLKEGGGQHPRRSPKLAVPWDRVRFPIPPRLVRHKRGGNC